MALDPLWRREPGVSDLYPPAPPLRLRDWDRHELVEVEAAEGASELTTVIEHRHGAWLGVVFLRRRDAFAPVVRRRLLAAHRLREGGREQGLDDEGDVEDAVAEEMQVRSARTAPSFGAAATVSLAHSPNRGLRTAQPVALSPHFASSVLRSLLDSLRPRSRVTYQRCSRVPTTRATHCARSCSG